MRTLIIAILIGSLTHGLAAGPAIGVAMATGTFRIDGSEVNGNASLFDGSEVTTADASSKLRLKAGARLEIGTNSQVKIFAARAVLEKGAGQVEARPEYPLEARTLRVNAAGAKAIARVRLDGADAIQVSAVNGPVRVSTASGILLANVAAGRNLRFVPQAGAADSFEVTGCLLRKNARLIIVDQTTGQVFELQGQDVSAQLGNRVFVRGTGVAGAEPPAIRVQSVTQVAPGGCLATASSVGADPPPGAVATGQPGPKTEPSKGVNKAVIAGVIIGGGAAVGIGIALAGKDKSK
jgi:hypothetical protein